MSKSRLSKISATASLVAVSGNLGNRSFKISDSYFSLQFFGHFKFFMQMMCQKQQASTPSTVTHLSLCSIRKNTPKLILVLSKWQQFQLLAKWQQLCIYKDQLLAKLNGNNCVFKTKRASCWVSDYVHCFLSLNFKKARQRFMC